MAVLIEMYSVVIRKETIDANWNWSDFVAAVPNKSMYTDGFLVRAGFMNFQDVEDYTALLEQHGLQATTESVTGDYALVDQLQGPRIRPSWLEYGMVQIDNNPDNNVFACRLQGDTDSPLVSTGGTTTPVVSFCVSIV